MSSLKKDVLLGTIWSTAGQMLTMLIVLITNVILARMLSPQDFGRIAVIMFFIVISSVVTEGGLGGALVRKMHPEREDYSTVFVFNMLVSSVCYGLLFLFSKHIAMYYNDPSIEKLLDVSGVVLILNAFQVTQNAKMMREMRFKEKNLYRFVAVCLASMIGLICAFGGAGIWSLVIIQVLTALFLTAIIWVREEFFFDLRFKVDSFKSLYAFGVNTTLASLLDTGFDNVYQIILARYFSIAQVGMYYQAKKLQDVPGGIITIVTQSVLFSSLTKFQDNKLKFKSVYNDIVVFYTIGLSIIACLLYIYAENIILLLYGNKWIGSVFYMKLLSIASFFYFQEIFNRLIFKVFNKTRQILILEVVKKVIHTITILVGVLYLNVMILILGLILTNALSYLINYYCSRKILGDINGFELYALLKISILSVLSVMLFNSLIHIVGARGYYTFLFLPVYMFIYLLLLRFSGIINLLEKVKMIRQTLKA
jgi:teichuronic acid exporter